jgi:hypothetical protein
VKDYPTPTQFLWGALLAWGPWVPTLVGLRIAFGGVFSQKATGLGAVAAGLAESFVICGIVAVVIGQVAAIILLLRAFSREHWFRKLFSLLSICMSFLMIVLVGLFLWWSWFQTNHN